MEKLQELNSYVQIDVHSGEITNEFLSTYSAVVMTESNQELNTRINEFCRSQPKPIIFLACESYGPAGFAFADFGPKFNVLDKDGEECKSFVISSISNENPALVTVHEEKRHSYEDGDHVTFREVEGMTEING